MGIYILIILGAEIEEEKRLKKLADLAQLLNPPKTPEDNNARDLLFIEKTKSERQSKLSRMGDFLESPAITISLIAPLEYRLTSPASLSYSGPVQRPRHRSLLLQCRWRCSHG
jgi:hypothetical protein